MYYGNKYKTQIGDPKPEKKEKVKKGIKKVSDKAKKENREYQKERIEFLSLPENKKCFVDGCKRSANTIEHQKGRKGFADKWARDNGITLKMDKRYWKPCCIQHNLEFENNSDLSKQYQLSKLHEGKKL